MRNWITRAALMFICWGALAASAWADPWKCCHCGSCEAPRQVCRLVPGVERVVDYEYYVRCEQFCVQGKSCCVGCVPKECRDPRLPMQYEKVWQPTCGPTFTRGKLCKRPIICERPVMRCVLEQVCCGCGAADPKQEVTGTWNLESQAPDTARMIPPGGDGSPPANDQSMFGGAAPWIGHLLHPSTSSSSKSQPASIATRPVTTR